MSLTKRASNLMSSYAIRRRTNDYVNASFVAGDRTMAVDTQCPKCRHNNIFAVAARLHDGSENATGQCLECGHTWERRVLVMPRVWPTTWRNAKPGREQNDDG